MFFQKLAVAGLMVSSLVAGPLMAQTSVENVNSAEEVAKEVEAQDLHFKLETNQGTIILQLDAASAPNTVANFKRYVDENFFEGLIFHRVIKGFMIQGGGFTPDMEHKPGFEAIAIESNNGLKNEKGSIAMARTSDPNSATSQFFINTENNTFLDYPGQDGYGYTVFGRVISGMDVVSKIENAEVGMKAGHRDVPLEPIVIEKITEIDAPLMK